MLSQAQSIHGKAAVITRQKLSQSSAPYSSVAIRLQEQELYDRDSISQQHEEETVGYIIVEANDSHPLIHAGIAPEVDHHWQRILFPHVNSQNLTNTTSNQNLTSSTIAAEEDHLANQAGFIESASFTWPGSPFFLAGLQSYNDSDTASLHYGWLRPNRVYIYVEEEQSYDYEMEHAKEAVGWLVVRSGTLQTEPNPTKLRILQTTPTNAAQHAADALMSLGW